MVVVVGDSAEDSLIRVRALSSVAVAVAVEVVVVVVGASLNGTDGTLKNDDPEVPIDMVVAFVPPVVNELLLDKPNRMGAAVDAASGLGARPNLIDVLTGGRGLATSVGSTTVG